MGGDQTKKHREILNNSKHGGFDPKLNEYGGGGGVLLNIKEILWGHLKIWAAPSLFFQE